MKKTLLALLVCLPLVAQVSPLEQLVAHTPATAEQMNRILGSINDAIGLKLVDPTTTTGDMIYRSSSGVVRLSIGSTGQCLLVSGGVPGWGACGFSDPTTTTGDMIYRTVGGTTRLPAGSTGQVLTISGGIPAWGSASGTGDVTGGSASGTGELAAYSSTTGKAIGRTNTLTGVLKATAGVPSIVTGANTNCVLVDGTSAACGSSGSVASVYGRTGTVTAARRDYTPDLVGALPDDFTFIHVPDPHLNQTPGPAGATAMGVWITANQVKWNIQGVFGTGDFTGINNDTIRTTNFNSAYTSIFTPVEALTPANSVPWITAPGNHDYDGDSPVGRRTTIFDSLLGYTKLSGKSYYGGAYTDANGDKANQYIRFTVGSRKFLIIALEFYPRSGAVAWAQGIITANPDYEVIIVTHACQKTDGSWGLTADAYGPAFYTLPGADYDGAEIVAAFKDYPNVTGIWNGHWLDGGATARTSSIVQRNSYGRMVHFLFANFQQESTDTSWLALYRFRPSRGTIEVYYVKTSDGTFYSSNPAYTIPWDTLGMDTTSSLPTGIGSRRDVVQFPGGVCQAGTASTGFGSLVATAPAAPECIGTTNPQGVQPLAATKVIYHHFALPTGWVRGSMQVDIGWRSSSTTGNATFNLNGGCAAAGAVSDPTLSSTADTVTAATGGTANILTVSTVDLYNSQFACSPGQEFFFSITGGTHTVGSDPRIQWVTFRYAR